MSSVSMTSSKLEKTISDLKQELEALVALNTSLQRFLENLQSMRKDLQCINSNCKELMKVNQQWVDTINAMK